MLPLPPQSYIFSQSNTPEMHLPKKNALSYNAAKKELARLITTHSHPTDLVRSTKPHPRSQLVKFVKSYDANATKERHGKKGFARANIYTAIAEAPPQGVGEKHRAAQGEMYMQE